MDAENTGNVSALGATASVLALTAQIVSAHVARNQVQTDALPGLIQSVHTALSNVGSATGTDTATGNANRPEPAVPVKKSVFPGYIICLEDGKKLKMLKRHLKSSFNMTPEQYRERWGLPASYPMVASDYAEKRSALAKTIGLGTKRKAAAVETKTAAKTARKASTKKKAAAA